VTAEDPTVLAVSQRSFVLVAGIPGAGKSSMLARRPIRAPGAVVLDSDPVREWLRDRFAGRHAVPALRGLVHLWYRLQIVLAALIAVGPWWCTCRPPPCSPGPAWSRWRCSRCAAGS